MESVLYKRLDIQSIFETLGQEEKLYAYHMSRAAWLGSRIIFRQVSPESGSIFDLIVELYRSCKGAWVSLLDKSGSKDAHDQIRNFLQYAALFLNNMGNYYGQGDQKIIPKVTRQFMEDIVSTSPKAQELAKLCLDSMLSPTLGHLGYPTASTQSGYYPQPISAEEVRMVTELMVGKAIGVENTRIVKNATELNMNGKISFDILQASILLDDSPPLIGNLDIHGGCDVRLVRGDYSSELKRVDDALSEAIKYTANHTQREMIAKLQKSLLTGSLEDFKESQKLWVKDLSPKVETLFGFLEVYRDPYGSRAEFEGVVTVLDPEGSKALEILCKSSRDFISVLPWVQNSKGGGINGPYENDLFEAPEYTAVHALAYASTMVYLGINLPNFEDIRQNVGFKNVFIANRDQALVKEELKSEMNAPFIDESEREKYLLQYQDMENLNIAIHELLGHGTGKLLSAASGVGEANFDVNNPPISPLTGKPIQTWYQKGETYNGVFGDLATTVEECRAECVGAYLVFEKNLSAIFGYTDTSDVKADDLIYGLYLHRGNLGLGSLRQFDPKSNTWGQAHARGHFAIMRALLASDGFMTLDVNKEEKKIIVRIDRSKLLTCGRKAIGDLLLRIHIYRCTADVKAAREYYTKLTEVDDEWLAIREIVESHKSKKEVFVQGNAILKNGDVQVKEYERSAEGLVQSWAERCVLLNI